MLKGSRVRLIKAVAWPGASKIGIGEIPAGTLGMIMKDVDGALLFIPDDAAYAPVHGHRYECSDVTLDTLSSILDEEEHFRKLMAA